ncbi:MAG: hypothetical protein ACTSR8_16230 [Promethearchaeota archaeon]
MKQMLDLVKRAMELKKIDFDELIKTNPVAAYYGHGELQILDYVIDNSLLPEDIRDTLQTMYDNGVAKYREAATTGNMNDEIVAELIGAADILAWILNIPEEQHKKSKELLD